MGRNAEIERPLLACECVECPSHAGERDRLTALGDALAAAVEAFCTEWTVTKYNRAMYYSVLQNAARAWREGR